MRRAGFLCAALLLSVARPAAAADFESYKNLALSAGTWTYRPTAEGSEASFGQSLVLRCHRASRTVSLTRVGMIPGTATTTILTSSGQKTLLPGAVFSAADPFLDSLAFSRGRMIVSVGSLMPLLAVPAWPEAARSIEDCRI